jgi:hypothetical protein
VSGGALAVVLAFSFALVAAAPAETREDLSPRPILPTQSILWVSPEHGEENVSLDRPIVIAFAEPINFSSIVLLIVPFVGNLSFWWNGSAFLTVFHTPFWECTLYSISIDFAGDPGGVANPWSFRTVCLLLPAENLEIGDAVLPLLCISRTSPADGEDNVSLGAPIIVEFCAPPDMMSTWFSLAPSAEPYSNSWSNGDTFLTIHHLRPFEPCTQYWATIGSDFGDYTWTFFTVCAFLPGDDLTFRRM